MVKSNKQFICQFCGTIHLKWSGKCEQCNQWNSLLEENTSKPSGPLSKSSGQKISFEFLNNDTQNMAKIEGLTAHKISVKIIFTLKFLKISLIYNKININSITISQFII